MHTSYVLLGGRSARGASRPGDRLGVVPVGSPLALAASLGRRAATGCPERPGLPTRTCPYPRALCARTADEFRGVLVLNPCPFNAPERLGPRSTRKRRGCRVRCSAGLGVVPWSHGARRIVVLRVCPTEVVVDVVATGRSNINVL